MSRAVAVIVSLRIIRPHLGCAERAWTSISHDTIITEIETVLNFELLERSE